MPPSLSSLAQTHFTAIIGSVFPWCSIFPMSWCISFICLIPAKLTGLKFNSLPLNILFQLFPAVPLNSLWGENRLSVIPLLKQQIRPSKGHRGFLGTVALRFTLKEDLFTRFQTTDVLTFQSRRVLEQLYQGPARGSVVLYPGGRSQRNGYRLNSGTADTCTTGTQKYQSNQSKQLV